MHLRLIRHATLRLELDGRHVVVDPMLDPAGARAPVPGAADDRRNPLVELPEPAEVVVAGLDAVLVTHLHPDHLDETATGLLPRDLPVFCPPAAAERLRTQGFADVRAVEGSVDWEGIAVTRTPARSGSAEPAERACGFLLRDSGGRTLYVAGPTALDAGVEAVLAEHRPDVVVVFACGARPADGDPVTMTCEEVAAVARRAPGARVVAVHMDAVGHCSETRADLHQRLHDEDLTSRVTVPEDGAAVPVD